MIEDIELGGGNVDDIYPGYVLGDVAVDETPESYSIRVFSELSRETSPSLRSVRGTLKFRQTPNGRRGTFDAKVKGIDPRLGDQLQSRINVKCEYAYEI